MERRRSGETTVEDLRREEWESFTGGQHIDPKSQFRVKPAPVPDEVADILAGVTQVLRLREVRALRGFTRIDPIPDIGDLGEVAAVAAGLAPIAAKRRNWLARESISVAKGSLSGSMKREFKPGSSSRKSAALKPPTQRRKRRWYRARQLPPPNARPARYLLLHSIAHLLIRQFGLDCGYASASLRERLYCADRAEPPWPVSSSIPLARTRRDRLGDWLRCPDRNFSGRSWTVHSGKLGSAQTIRCAPIASPGATGTQLNGAACHACLLQAETSCETGNNYLDRAVVTGTLRKAGTAFAQRS